MTRVGTSYNEYPATQAIASVLLGAQLANEDHIVINGWSFEIQTDGGLPTDGGDEAVDTTGNGTAAFDVASIVAAINASTATLIAGVVTAVATESAVLLFADTPGTAGNAITLTDDATNATTSGATFSEGIGRQIEAVHVHRHTVVTIEETSTQFIVPTSLAAVNNVSAVWQDAGVITTNDATFTISGTSVIVTEVSAWAAGDVLVVTITGPE